METERSYMYYSGIGESTTQLAFGDNRATYVTMQFEQRHTTASHRSGTVDRRRRARSQPAACAARRN